MTRRTFMRLSFAFITCVAVWISAGSNTEWDYPIDAGPPIDALVHLRIHDFLAAHPVMGPLSLVFRAPFAAIGQVVGNGGPDHNYLDDYRYGTFACLVVAGSFGLALARFAENRGRGPLVCAAAVVLSVLNPVSLRAVHFGHAEEVFGAALLAGAMLAAVARRPWLAAALVAMAVANKQWGLIGLPAVLVVLWASVGFQRLRVAALIPAGAFVLLAVPLLIVDAHGVVDLTRRMADIRGTYVWPASLWYGLAPELPPAKAAISVPGLHDMPDLLGLVARPLIILVGIAVPLLLARRVREDVLHRAFPLLALVMLLRCALDPADNGYYHVPFLIALIAADTINGRFYATAVACVVLQLPTTLHLRPETLSLFYACWAPAFVVYLAGRTYGLDWVAWIRSAPQRSRPT